MKPRLRLPLRARDARTPLVLRHRRSADVLAAFNDAVVVMDRDSASSCSIRPPRS